MKTGKTGIRNNDPIIQLLILSLLIIGFTLLGMIVAGIISVVFYHLDQNQILSAIQSSSTQYIPWLKMMQTVLSIFLFIIPSLVFVRLYPDTIKHFFNFNIRYNAIFLIVSSIIFVISQPILSGLMEFNSVFGFESNQQNIDLMRKFLSTNTIGGFLYNLFMIAVIPAIGEEFLFRGVIQKTLINHFRNPILMIVITGFLFSFLHGEMNYLFPRWFMGIILGILYYFSNNLIVPIIAHFINNSIATIGFYIYQNYPGIMDKDPLIEQPDTNLTLLFLSIIAVSIIFNYIYKFRTFKVNTIYRAVKHM